MADPRGHARSLAITLSDQRILDLIVATIGIALGGAAIVLVPDQISGQTFAALGDMSSSAFMPILSSLLLVVSGVILALQSLVRLLAPNPEADRAAPSSGYVDAAPRDDPRREPGHAGRADLHRRAAPLIQATVIFGGYLLLTAWAGMLLATVLMMLALSLAYGYRRPATLVATLVITPIAIYFVFERLLLVILPHGGWF